MDFLSIAGFALNVASYLKENPVDLKVTETPVAAEALEKKSKGIADLQLPAVVPRPQDKREHRYPKGVSAYQQQTSVNQEGQISMSRIDEKQAAPEEPDQPSFSRDQRRAKEPHSGINQSGQYFFRKRGS